MGSPEFVRAVFTFMGVLPSQVGWCITIRRRCPALLVVLGVTVGEIIAWYASVLHLLIGILGLGLLLCVGFRRPGVFVGGVLLGLIAAGPSIALKAAPLDAVDVQLLVQVEENPTRRKPGEVSFIGRELLGDVRGRIRCRAIDLPWRNTGELRRGDRLWVRGAVSGIDRPDNPFSWSAWLWRQGVRGEMKVLFASEPVSSSPSFVERVREGILHLVRDTVGDSRGGALFLSMAFGFRDVLSSPVEDMFSSLGLSHLLVVSGYQVSLVFGCVFGLLTGYGGRVFPGLRARNVATVLSFLVACLYVILVGSEMSALRALIAAACLCAAFTLDRRHGFFQRWAVALLLMEIVWPWCFFEIGVLLTFAALAGIGIGSSLGGSSRVASTLWVSVSVWLLTSTILVVWSGTISLGSIVLNALLATVWSMLNCTVGVIGVLLQALHVWPGSEILRIVSTCNEEITQALFLLSTWMRPAREFEGPERLVVSSALLLLSIFAAAFAHKRYPTALVRSVVR